MPGPLESLLVGRTLVDRYEIEEAIGRGGMSIVYRARDRRLDREVALKVLSLPSSAAEDREHLRDRLRREAESAARIPPHPNVVQVYDYGTDPSLDLDFIVMELLRGRELRDALRDRPPHGPEALRIVREAARGVAAGHRAGIVHRDVKPGNILLVGDRALEAVKILDFGIAKALEAAPGEDLTRTGQTPHSPAYASPEQMRGEHALLPASDVYQLGLVAYEVLTGERPFDEEDRGRLRDGERVPPAPTPAWSSLAPGLRDVIATALRPDPRDRYPDASAFLDALVAAEGDATALPRPAAPSGAPARRPGLPWKPAAAALAALVGVWAVVEFTGGESREPAADPAGADVAALDEEFRPILLDAHDRLREEAGPVEGAEAAEAVQAAIADLNESWVEGELDRHLEHYADRVDFYAASGAPRSRVEAERRADLERYPRREIGLDRVAVTFPAPGRARALVDKSWVFEGAEERREGSARQELMLELRDGRWLVVSEKILETYR